ncbi:MAG: hemerythrin domain-containing protein [Burkholderiaceae bacterium]
MQPLYEELRRSHELQRRLCTRLVRTSAKRPERRQSLLRELQIELASHAAAEERYLYAPMLMDDRGLDSSRHALAEHHDIDELVEKLWAMAPDGEAWLDHAKALTHKVRHHLREEEHKFFQLSGRILSDPLKAQLARRYERDYRRMICVMSAAA